MIKLITHTDLDGVGCAILAKYVYGDNVDITFSDYDEVNNIMETLDYDRYESILMTDLSCDLDHISKLNKLIDHHKTALYLNKYDNCKVEVERSNGVLTCGTSMFADYLEVENNFIFDVHMCYFIDLVQNYDTWAWKKKGMPEANDLNILFHAMGRDRFIEHILNCEEIFDNTANMIIECEYNNQCNYIEEKFKQIYTLIIGGNKYGFVFAEQYTSSLGDALIDKGYDVAVIIDMSDNTISFRSNDKVDVSEIARNLNGGGHKNASGAKPYWLKDIKDEIINSMVRMMGGIK